MLYVPLALFNDQYSRVRAVDLDTLMHNMQVIVTDAGWEVGSGPKRLNIFDRWSFHCGDLAAVIDVYDDPLGNEYCLARGSGHTAKLGHQQIIF